MVDQVALRFFPAAAKNQAALNPACTVFDAKRMIGRRFSDAEVQADMKHWPFQVVPGPAAKPMVRVEWKGERKDFAPEEISSMVLHKASGIRRLLCPCTLFVDGTLMRQDLWKLPEASALFAIHSLL